MKIRVFHSGYGCDTGCCGHRVEVDGKERRFFWDHADSNDPEVLRAFARELVERALGDCEEPIDWDSLVIDAQTNDNC